MVSGRLSSFFTAAFNLWGFLQVPQYDVIVIGAGAGGCSLAQTLAEGGLKVLLLERGGERVESSKQLVTAVDSLLDDCAESIRSAQGVTVTIGNCMGGATSVNQGIWVEERPEWVQSITAIDGAEIFSTVEIAAAFDWLRERVASEPTKEPLGGATELYFNSVVGVYRNRSDFNVGNVAPGQPFIEPEGVWRTHSIFHPESGRRRSADTLLDRSNANLVIRTNAKVSRILFDGDIGVPLTAGYKATGIPRARCVRLQSLEVLCVKAEGRIYVSSSALHTPEVLIKSGIGPEGSKVKNPNVGQNLVDKVAFGIIGSVQPGFDNANQLFFAHTAATQKGNSSQIRVYEDLLAGVTAMLPLSAWARNFVPTSLRNSIFADTASELIKFCQKNLHDPLFDRLGPSALCNKMVPIVNACCDKRVVGIVVLAGQPTSRGSVTLDAKGRLVVDANYMGTAHDKQVMGGAARIAFEMVTARTGSMAPQTPCVDKTDDACMSMSCPDLIADYVAYTKKTLSLVKPLEAYKFRTAPASVIFPHFIEPALANMTNDDLAIGELIREEIVAGQHFAGTAAFGSVVDGNFQVMGVEGLYVADASVLPTTPRGNPMATVMAMGRIAGLHAVKELKK